MDIFLIRHSEQLKLKGIKNVEESSQIENEKIILSIEGEKKAKEFVN
ncbi:unknown [Clostridium sp. CAG:465]|nr:unknown [Clostridium sp. CAG:465]